MPVMFLLTFKLSDFALHIIIIQLTYTAYSAVTTPNNGVFIYLFF